ncbi:hypothetical protein [Actinocorallia sp. A-T 12471]|uniref:hypothetical protein n=1 Tax=Actinocorallia sp. A-T 12471 TaxID=3089813 RepID=UPI0029D3ED57|nr:hypothetical protein [Actinocorallia sp. A-T 12471]MDX6744382.1 hypothetical protein [Actinocorallia sp. A-T 12471]
MSEMEYPVILALEDFVPVALTVTGVLLLAKLDDLDTRLVRTAAVLLGLGGFAKCGWKLLIASTDIDLWVMPLLLFPLLSAGFLTLIKALEPRLPIAAAAGVWMAGIATSFAIQDTMPMLVLTIGVSTAAAVYLFRRHKLFLLWIAGQYALGPLGGQEQTITLQWIEQSINTASQAVFAFASWRVLTLSKRKNQETPA